MVAFGSWRRDAGRWSAGAVAVVTAAAAVGVLASAAAAGVAAGGPGTGVRTPAPAPASAPASAPAKAKAGGDKWISGDWVGFADLEGEGELLKAKVDERGSSIHVDVIGLSGGGGASWTVRAPGLPAPAGGKFTSSNSAELTADGKLNVSFESNGKRLAGLLQRAGEVNPAQYARPRTWPLDGPGDQRVYLSFSLAIKKAQHFSAADALPRTSAAAAGPATRPASGPATPPAGESAEPAILIRPMDDEVLEPRGSRGRCIWPEIGCLIVPGKRVNYWDPPQRVIEIVQNGKSYPTAFAKAFDTRERLQKLAFSWVRPEGKEFTGRCEAYIYFREPKAPFRIISNIIKVQAKFVARRDQPAPE